MVSAWAGVALTIAILAAVLFAARKEYQGGKEDAAVETEQDWLWRQW